MVGGWWGWRFVFKWWARVGGLRQKYPNVLYLLLQACMPSDHQSETHSATTGIVHNVNRVDIELKCEVANTFEQSKPINQLDAYNHCINSGYGGNKLELSASHPWRITSEPVKCISKSTDALCAQVSLTDTVSLRSCDSSCSTVGPSQGSMNFTIKCTECHNFKAPSTPTAAQRTSFH